METAWHSYPKSMAIGHAAIRDIFQDDVVIEEKVDGSQFSFGVFDGILKCRSKGQEIGLDYPEKMFLKAVNTAKDLHGRNLLREGWMYSGEYLNKPKHNTLVYDRVPSGNIILFDIRSGMEQYFPYSLKENVAKSLGLEIVPLLFEGKIDKPEILLDLMKTKSCLGDVYIEGIVIKNYFKFGADGKAMMGKIVSHDFKEAHKTNWKSENPGPNDIIELLSQKYRHINRWQKALQHLQERGEITDTPRDIYELMAEVKADIDRECNEEIKYHLYEWAKYKILRSATVGLPEWYKNKLLKGAEYAIDIA